MKKITVTVKTEKTYEVLIDETIVDKSIIDNYAKYFSDEILDAPEELEFEFDDIEIKEEDYPYLNIAKIVAHQKAEFDNENVEGLPPVHRTNYPKSEDTPVGISISEEPSDVEFEFDFNKIRL